MKIEKFANKTSALDILTKNSFKSLGNSNYLNKIIEHRDLFKRKKIDLELNNIFTSEKAIIVEQKKLSEEDKNKILEAFSFEDSPGGDLRVLNNAMKIGNNQFLIPQELIESINQMYAWDGLVSWQKLDLWKGILINSNEKKEDPRTKIAILRNPLQLSPLQALGFSAKEYLKDYLEMAAHVNHDEELIKNLDNGFLDAKRLTKTLWTDEGILRVSLLHDSTLSEKFTNFKDLLKIFSDVAKGLEALHEKGYAHNNIRPDNILVYKTREGDMKAKVTGFLRLNKLNPPFDILRLGKILDEHMTDPNFPLKTLPDYNLSIRRDIFVLTERMKAQDRSVRLTASQVVEKINDILKDHYN